MRARPGGLALIVSSDEIRSGCESFEILGLQRSVAVNRLQKAI
jgi:hypothetical protein